MTNRIVFMGTPEFALPSLGSLIGSPYDVVVVYTQPDRKAGRGKEVAWSPVKKLAVSRGLRVVQPQTLRQPEEIELLKSFSPDVIVVAAYGQILPPAVLNLPKYGCLNIHPSLLPRHRGPSPIIAAILQGDEVTGVSIMLMDAGLDTGPILQQKKVAILDEDTAGSLSDKLSRISAQLLLETLPLWFEGRIKHQPQDESLATYSQKIAKEDGKIDWQLPALTIWRRVRAFNPWPGCYTMYQGKLLKIWEVIPLPEVGIREVGRVIALSPALPAPVGVITGDGILGLCQLQMEGKRRMVATEFVRGQRNFIGSHLP